MPAWALGVTIHAFATVEAGGELGDYCVVASRAVIKAGVKSGLPQRGFASTP